jgi:DnaJ-class molecular chaperone
MKYIDKNLDNPEEADLRFKELQNAYGVLSDANERAWFVLIFSKVVQMVFLTKFLLNFPPK